MFGFVVFCFLRSFLVLKFSYLLNYLRGILIKLLHLLNFPDLTNLQKSLILFL